MIVNSKGWVALLGKYLNHKINKYYRIIHKEALCAKDLDLFHVLAPVIHCIKFELEHCAAANFIICFLKIQIWKKVINYPLIIMSIGCQKETHSRYFWTWKIVFWNFQKKKVNCQKIADFWKMINGFGIYLFSDMEHLTNLNVRGRNDLFPHMFNNVLAFQGKLNVFFWMI